MTGYKNLRAPITAFLLLCHAWVSGQGLYQVPTDEKIQESSLIIEGAVVARRSFWNDAQTMIFTSNSIEIYKIFKGSSALDTIEVLTVGGTVGPHYVHASHLLSLELNEVGVFFCRPNQEKSVTVSSLRPVFDVYSSQQGFLKYDILARAAAAPFVKYDDIEADLYSELRNKTNRVIIDKKPSFNIRKVREALENRSNSILAPAITSFSPATVDGGALLDPANNELTINGSGFGSSPAGQAAVLFDHADYAPNAQSVIIPYNHQFIISWSDTEIKLRVPSQAATAPVRVRDNAGAVAASATNLVVRYTILNAEFGSPYGIKQFNLGNANGNGGYDIKYSTNTANGGVNINTSDAKATFQRALQTWKDGVGVNFVESGTTSSQAVDWDDAVNIVMFDNNGTGLAPLAAGVLATCFSGVTICTNNPSQNQAQKTGFDIVIRNTGVSAGNTPFTFGPCPPYSLSSNHVDLESVLLHELGHAMNLGHIRYQQEGSGVGNTNPPKVMHYSVAFNLRRISLDHAAAAGGLYQVTPGGHTYGNCVPASPEMTPVQTVSEAKDVCPASFPATTTPMLTTVNFDLAHATSDYREDPGVLQVTGSSTSTSLSNTVYYALRTNNLGGDLSIEVKNYSTAPAETGQCTPGTFGVPVTGVKMALYKLSSCPGGGNFPAPVTYQTFSGNGTLPQITGLDANSNYLLLVDGVQNTKAVFDMQFSGSALDIIDSELSGSVFTTYNLLNWTTESGFVISSMVLERSNDGVNFQPLAQITGEAQQLDGEYTDDEPLPGTNYYRLAIENEDGFIQYSTILLLQRDEGFSINVYPIPVESSRGLSVQILNNDKPTKYSITVVDPLGRIVKQREVTVTARSQVEMMELWGLAHGIYHLSVRTPDGRKIKSMSIFVR